MGGPAGDDALFDEPAPTRQRVSVSNAPLYVLWGLSAAAAVVAVPQIVGVVPQSVVWTAVAYAVLVVAAFVLLFQYRVSLVRASRSASGSGAVLGVRRLERITIVAVAIAAVANGVVLGRWLGGLELWFP